MHHHPNLVDSAVAKNMSHKLKKWTTFDIKQWFSIYFIQYKLSKEYLRYLYTSYGPLIFIRIYIRLNFWLTLLERHDHFSNGGKKNEFSPKAQDIFTSVFWLHLIYLLQLVDQTNILCHCNKENRDGLRPLRTYIQKPHIVNV